MNNEVDIKEIYREMELELISSMKRNLSRHLKEENRVGFEFTQWQAETLKELKGFQRENKDIIGNYTNPISKEISKRLKNELKQGSKKEFNRYKNILGDNYKFSDNLRHSFFNLNDRKITGLIKEVQGSTKTANTACFRMMNDQYRKVINKAVMFSNHGVVSPKKAIDMATKDFLSSGINCIQYKDGRRVNIADYCDMAVRTANTRAQLIGEGQFRQEIGEHLVKPTRHNTACEKCARWEDKILIDDVYSGGSKKDGKYPLLSEAMAQGFFHPRCEHGLPTYYKELEEIKFDENGPTEETTTEYQEDLNWINNNIQKYERLATGSLDEENINLYNKKKHYYKNKKTKILEIVQNLAWQEQRDLKEYLSSGSYKINEVLYSSSKLTNEEIRFINSLDDALTKIPKYKGYVNRSVDIKSQKQLNQILKIFDNKNKVGNWGSYISSSKSIYDENMKLQMKIKSKSGRDLSSLNGEGGGEILFERHISFKLIDYKIKDGKIYLELEEVE